MKLACGLVTASMFGSLLSFPDSLAGQTNQPVLYTLVDGSRLVDSCLLCDRVPIVVPLGGSFQLRLLSQNPLFTEYSVENLNLVAGGPNGPHYTVVGAGLYRVGGEVGVIQDLTLQVLIDNGATKPFCYFTNSAPAVTRPWPMLQTSVDQTNGTFVQQFHLDINAAPFREFWFSTTQGFTVSGWNPPTNQISAGDLISSVGRVVKRNADLTARLGIQPLVPDLGLKAVDVLPGGEIAFSVEQEAFSETLGPLSPGDLLSDQGRILRSNPQLIQAFSPATNSPAEVGLDSVQVLESGEIYFSTQTNFFSNKLARTIQRGDLLSDSGAIIKSNAELLAAFHPLATNLDFGLRSAHVWPSGEIWFTIEDGFYGASSNYYSPADILSDQGYVAYSSSTNGLGLDALFFVSDVTPLPASSGKTRLDLPILTNVPPSSVILHWFPGARVFQVEKSSDPAGPYLPLSPVTSDDLFLDVGGQATGAEGFYRIQQW